MDRGTIISKIRAYLGDQSEKTWSSVELNRMLNTATKLYCEDSRCFCSRVDFYPDTSGNYKFPSNYIFFQAGWDRNGNPIYMGKGRDIGAFYVDYVSVKGDPEFIYDESSISGYYKLCPDPIDILAATISGFTGGDYGVSLDDEYGEWLDDEYGVIVTITNYTFAGDMTYYRYGTTEEIKDYMALVYLSISMAFNTDAQKGSADKAQFFKSLYKQRISMLGHVKSVSNGKMKTVNFF